MLLKREMPEDVYDIVPQDPHDMVKVRLLEAQSPAMQVRTSPDNNDVYRAGPLVYGGKVASTGTFRPEER